LWYASGLYPRSAVDIVRTPQPDHSESPISWSAIASTRSGDRILLSVEGERVVAVALAEPERLVEAPVELVGFPVETLGELAVAPDLAGELGRAPFRVEDVALHLARRDRRLRDTAVGEALRVE
jgi:hypothetical protein